MVAVGTFDYNFSNSIINEKGLALFSMDPWSFWISKTYAKIFTSSRTQLGKNAYKNKYVWQLSF